VDSEIGRIVNLGVTMKLGTFVGKDIQLDVLKNQFKAVYVAIGALVSTAMGVEGEDDKALLGLAFLKSVKEKNRLHWARKSL
jgi:NADPH-dependent glutamate synthase beta subunit-like oxidoreductase